MDFTKPTIYILAFNSSRSRYHDYYKLICEIVRNAFLKISNTCIFIDYNALYYHRIFGYFFFNFQIVFDDYRQPLLTIHALFDDSCGI